MPTPQEIEAAHGWFQSNDPCHYHKKPDLKCATCGAWVLARAHEDAESQLSEWCAYLKTYPNAKEVNAEMKRLERQIEIQKADNANLADQVNRMAKERDQLAATGWALKEDIDSLKMQISVMAEVLNSIAKDDRCGQHHDAMAQDGLKRAYECAYYDALENQD